MLSNESQSDSAAMPAPTLEFASICLQNALFLLPTENSNSNSEKVTVTALPGQPIRGDGILDLK